MAAGDCVEHHLALQPRPPQAPICFDFLKNVRQYGLSPLLCPDAGASKLQLRANLACCLNV